MVPLVYELAPGPEPAAILADTWGWLRSRFGGQCGRSWSEPADGARGTAIYRTVLEVPAHVGAYLLCLDALTAIDVAERRRAAERGSPWPGVYSGALRYHPEPPGYEIWASTPALHLRGVGDCEDLAADRAAELQLSGHPARAILRHEGGTSSGGTAWHVLVGHPDGSHEDPSVPLGML